MSKLENTFNIEKTVKPKVTRKTVEPEVNITRESEVDSDYYYIRSNLYKIIEVGQEALQEALELARDTEHPRAYEAVASLIKDLSTATDKVMNLQKNVKEIKESKPTKETNVTNNTIIGTTSDIIHMLKKGISSDLDEVE